MSSISAAHTTTTAPDGALAPIALGPGEGGHFWFFGGLTTIKADGEGAGGRMMLTEETARSDEARFLLVTRAAGFEGFIRTLGAPAPVAEIPPAPTAPPDMEPVLRAAADHGLEILGPPGIPA